MSSFIESARVYPTNIDQIYNITVRNIQYSTNLEYRNHIRSIFYMRIDHAKLEKLRNSGIDEESIDEMIYDDDTISKTMDIIYENTYRVDIFCELYKEAAAKMLSTSLEIGLVVLFSYDFFKLFHECLVEYFSAPDKFTRECISYITLYNFLLPRKK
jgi:hypothetical protein